MRESMNRLVRKVGEVQSLRCGLLSTLPQLEL